MSLQDIVILVPSHSLEDFPTEQADKPASSLLNTFAVAWHPELLAWTGALPRWRRADEPSALHSGQLIFVPTVCDDWLPHGWVDDARAAGATVVSGLHERAEIAAAAVAALPERYDIATDLVDDFFSLGFCWLQVELLTRHMRNFGNIDEPRLQQRAVAAAKAALDNDRETAEAHLRGCFELLLEAREKFYPVECYLLDLCLTSPDVSADKLATEAVRDVPWSLLTSASDLETICQKSPAILEPLRAACAAGRVSIVGGEDRETPLPLLPLESALCQFHQGRSRLNTLLGQTAIVWGRRKFGLTSQLPQLLHKFGFKGALHVVLDDGIYPDAEHTKLRWRGCDESIVDALSRIPLAADSPSSYLRLPVRMAESMDHDQAAGLVFARWPDVASPFFEDLRRSQKYAPALGRFVTFDRFFQQTELPGLLSTHKAHEYFPPYLILNVARREADPLSRYSDHALRRRRFDVAEWCRSLAKALVGQPVDETPATGELSESADAERCLEEAAPDPIAGTSVVAEQMLSEVVPHWQQDLAQLVVHGGPQRRGFLVVNSLSFTRRVCVSLPGLLSPPEVSGPIKAVQFDAARPDEGAVVVELPGAGYVWIPEDARAPLASPQKPPLVEDGVLRNEWFEVSVNEQTGGIGHVRFHDQRAKRVSQQLSFRFPRERTVGTGDEAYKTQYAEMRCRSREVVSRGPTRGEIATVGDIVDPSNNERLATFRQTIRVWRARPVVEIDIELNDLKLPDGDPWNNYFASRFAWNDGTSAVTRSVFHAAQGFAGERFETSDYIEAASESERLTIIPHGLPYHRKTGPRMVDSLLIVGGETKRRFQFTLAIDAPLPLEAAWNATTPAAVVPTELGPPRAGTTGWFFHLDARNVQLTRVLPLITPHTSAETSSNDDDYTALTTGPGFAVRLIETEGRAKRVRLRTFRQPLHARKRDFVGSTLYELTLEGDSVLIDIAAYEIAEVELRFGA